MATLTELASITRKIIKFGGIGFISFIVLRLAFIAGLAYWQKLHPAPPPPATVEFGKLKKLTFPAQTPKTLNFNLQLPTLDFPTFSDRAKVFVIPYKKANFMVWDEAKKEASALGFTSEPEQLSSQDYRWSKNAPVTTSLKMNIIDGSFEFEYSWQEDPSILSAKNLPGEQQAIADTMEFLRKVKSSDLDLKGDESKVNYVKVTGTKLVPAMSFSEADLATVNIFRSKIDDLPVVTADPNQGVVSALLSGSSNQRVLKITFNYFPINSSLFATYPLKTAEQAWQDLKNGQGYFASLSEKTDNVVVRRVYLGYYDSLTPMPYLQPIYIFTGDNDFIGYVAAVTNEWQE